MKPTDHKYYQLATDISTEILGALTYVFKQPGHVNPYPTKDVEDEDIIVVDFGLFHVRVGEPYFMPRIGGSMPVPGFALCVVVTRSNYPHEPDDADVDEVAFVHSVPALVEKAVELTGMQMLNQYRDAMYAEDMRRRKENYHQSSANQ